ncbi:Ig-like domain-containing protein [Rufibacter latericius]|nr:Ig-like domain-containing protein [Rufibacter latericius]
MKKYTAYVSALLLLVLGLFSWGCDQEQGDELPLSFQDFKIYPDEMYTLKNNGGWSTFELRPLVNDSIRTQVTIKYSQPVHGQLASGCNGGTEMCYVFKEDFVGDDSLTYTVCSDKICKTEKILLHIEEPLPTSQCISKLGADSLETTMNTPKEIKLFANDILFCPGGSSYGPIVVQPRHGSLRFYDYGGTSYKSVTFIYTPHANYVGEDSFTYRADMGYGVSQDMPVKVTVKAN